VAFNRLKFPFERASSKRGVKCGTQHPRRAQKVCDKGALPFPRFLKYARRRRSRAAPEISRIGIRKKIKTGMIFSELELKKKSSKTKDKNVIWAWPIILNKVGRR
jgi:hypothetical protein